MLLVPLENRGAVKRPQPVDRLCLRCDEKGCTLSGGRFERHFPDLRTAIEYARRSRETGTATIEIWQDGEYICCKAPPRRSDVDFPHPLAPVQLPRARLAAAERQATRISRILMATAGPFFWLCLLITMVAAIFGWQLLHQ